MSTEMPDSRSTRPLDRFSLLPNELLDEIFDDAYTFKRPLAPLSKRLYPFFERCRYRTVFLRSPDHFHAFSRVLNLHPDRGQLVTAIEFYSRSFCRDDPPKLSLDKLLSKLPKLVSLYLPFGPNEYLQPLPETMERLKQVTLVGFRGYPFRNMAFRLSDFASLSALPALSELNITNWSGNFEEEEFPACLPKMKRVKTLHLAGDGADEAIVAELAYHCPELLHLSLNCQALEETTLFPRLVPLLPTTLQSLRLVCYMLPADHFCDEDLPRFSQLRKLDLSGALFSYNIHTALAQLPNLVEIRLDGGYYDFEGLASLVSGPSPLANLALITLDTDFPDSQAEVFFHQNQMKRPSDPAFSLEDTASLPDGQPVDWVPPSEWLPDPIGLGILREACDANGVTLRGQVLDEWVFHDAVEKYYIEANNRAVFRTWDQRGERQMSELREIRDAASRARVTLPPLDIDSLDIDRLEIVEISLEIPYERDYEISIKYEGGFVLSLKNKSGRQVI